VDLVDEGGFLKGEYVVEGLVITKT